MILELLGQTTVPAQTTTDLEYVVVAAGILVFFLILLWRIIIPRWVQKRKDGLADGASWVEDRAWNQIQAGNALADYLEKEGVRAAEARSLLEQAMGKYELKRYGDAQRMAKEATDLLATQRKKLKTSSLASDEPASAGASGASASARTDPGTATSSASEPRVYRDLSHRVGDPDPDEPPTATSNSSIGTSRSPAPSASAGSAGRVGQVAAMPEDEGGESPPEDENQTVAARQKMPKNFLEARFMLGSLQTDLQSASPETLAGPAGKEAQDWAKQCQAAFDRKDYDTALRLALRGRRRLGGGGGLSTIELSPGTVVEAPPSQPSSTAQRSSAPTLVSAAGPVSISCPKCGRSNTSTDRFCRGCGTQLSKPTCARCQRPVEADDKFCHGCGAPLGGAP